MKTDRGSEGRDELRHSSVSPITNGQLVKMIDNEANADWSHVDARQLHVSNSEDKTSSNQPHRQKLGRRFYSVFTLLQYNS